MVFSGKCSVKQNSDNLFASLMARECGASRSGAQVNRAREFYERITPNVSIQGIDNPDCYIKKFVDDGQHLVSDPVSTGKTALFLVAKMYFLFFSEVAVRTEAEV